MAGNNFLADKRLPHNKDLEGEAVAAAYGLPPGPRDLVLSGVRREYFYSKPFSVLFGHAETSGFTPSIAYDAMQTEDKDACKELSREEFYATLNRDFSEEFDPSKLADRMRKLWVRRETIKLGADMLQEAWAGDVDLDQTNHRVAFIEGSGDIGELKTSTADEEVIRRAEDGMPENETTFTGFPRLDLTCRGLQRTEFVVIAGMPNVGKTPLLINTAVNRADLGLGMQLLFSLEMTKAQILQKIVSQKTGIPLDSLNYGVKGSGARSKEEQIAKIKETLQWANERFLIWDPSVGNIDMVAIKSISKRASTEHKLDAIYIDYLQLLGDSYDELTHNSRSMKALPLKIGVPLVVISSLNNEFEKRMGGDAPFVPRLSDLRGCGNIGYDASKVLFMMSRDDDGSSSDRVQVYCLKSKFGPGKCWSGLKFDKAKQRYIEEPNGDRVERTNTSTAD